MKLTDALSESGGQVSSIRVLSFMAMLVACILTIHGTITGTPVDNDILIIWLTAALCPKVIQKFAENKITRKD